jgi:hypothetical protein
MFTNPPTGVHFFIFVLTTNNHQRQCWTHLLDSCRRGAKFCVAWEMNRLIPGTTTIAPYPLALPRVGSTKAIGAWHSLLLLLSFTWSVLFLLAGERIVVSGGGGRAIIQ